MPACGPRQGERGAKQLADGGLSPMVSRDRNGPIARLLSVSKLRNVLDTKGFLLNVKLSPLTLAGEVGLWKLMAYLAS